jgi:hypothetical protein
MVVLNTYNKIISELLTIKNAYRKCRVFENLSDQICYFALSENN